MLERNNFTGLNGIISGDPHAKPAPEGRNPHPHNADLCRATMRMRERMEGLLDRIDALELELAAERAMIAAERADLAAHMESPEAERDVMLLAQDLLRSEMIDAASLPKPRGLCGTCGGLGHGMTNGLLVGRINDHCERHGLSQVSAPMDDSAWPHVGAGRQRNEDWLRKPKPELREREW